MTPLDHAVRDITQALDVLGIAYAIVGGIANAVWGEPRATIDVDVTVAVDEADLTTTVRAIARSANLKEGTFVAKNVIRDKSPRQKSPSS